MKKLKQQFIDLKNSTPKHLQWLLLAAAFIVVLILLTLVFGGDKKEDISNTKKVAAKLVIDPDMIDWSNVTVGQKKTQTVKISANKPVKMLDVRQHKEINGFHITQTCKKQKAIDSKIGCVINATYEPTTAMASTQVPVFIDWHAADEPVDMKRTDKIVLSLGAVAPVVEKKSAPVAEKKPEPVIEKKPVVIEEPEIEEEAVVEEEVIKPAKPVKQEIKKEIEAIAPAIEFEEEVDEYIPAPEACSDFAFPGYDNRGRQIGWIKPEGGAYKFHPFSDTECDSPTGIYNPDNGIITDIKNSGKRIGTDAEHIGFSAISSGVLPELSNAPAVRQVNRAVQLDEPSDSGGAGRLTSKGFETFSGMQDAPAPEVNYIGTDTASTVVSSMIQDRQFLLRQYKPIPATIVSDVRADPDTLANNHLPVRATVDRNVYSDNGRNVIIPAGTLMLGYVTGKLPGPYTSIGRMDIKWYQFILPNGVEFNFSGNEPFSGDAQGRSGIPGYGSTDYLEQFFMPMLTAIVPAAVNLIAPISDAFVNQIDLDNNTVVQSGTMRSSEMAKNEIISAWNQVAQKLMVDMMDNTVPPFTIAAGTRITVYSPVDLMVTCGAPGTSDKKCAIADYGSKQRHTHKHDAEPDYDDGTWVGQARSFNLAEYCTSPDSNGKRTAKEECKDPGACGGYDYRTVLMYCESLTYTTKSKVKQKAYHESEVKKYQDTYGTEGDRDEEQQAAYDEMIGITYDDEGYVENPYAEAEPAPEEATLTCMDGSLPDANGCCAGEIYTDMGEMGFNCCPEAGGDCFPPIL